MAFSITQSRAILAQEVSMKPLGMKNLLFMDLEQELSHRALPGARAEVGGWDPGLRPWRVTGLWLKPASGPIQGDICTHPGQGVAADKKSCISMCNYTG